MFSGMPIAFSLGLVATVFMIFFMPPAALDTVTQNVYEEMSSITLLSIRCSSSRQRLWRCARTMNWLSCGAESRWEQNGCMPFGAFCPILRLAPIADGCAFWRALSFPLERFVTLDAVGLSTRLAPVTDVEEAMSELAVLDPRAAFVDVGSEKMHVSIGGGPPRVFGTVTSQLQALRDYLIEHQVRSVAMEATGVYWLPLYSVVEAAGLDVRMVDGRQTRHLPGRKSDMQDCQWGAIEDVTAIAF